MPAYAIIKVGSKQYRVREGERLLVDRLGVDESKRFHPEVLLHGDDGKVDLAPKGVQVTARVVGHTLGEKIRIGKYRRRTGYRRHAGHRSHFTQIEIESIGKKGAARTSRSDDKAEPASGKKAGSRAGSKSPTTRTTSSGTKQAKKES